MNLLEFIWVVGSFAPVCPRFLIRVHEGGICHGNLNGRVYKVFWGNAHFKTWFTRGCVIKTTCAGERRRFGHFWLHIG